ncbi:MAG: RNA-binding protein [Halobacteriales archaeon]|nr:RNA-binding protein [Halobacteriales archaeon]
MEIRSRHHLRDDEADDMRDALRDAIGVSPPDDASIEEAEVEDGPDLFLVDGEPLVVRIDGDYFVTVQGALALEPKARLVTVDAGAVEFVTNGADVMRPGVVEADEDIVEGDLVVIVEENHGKPLAVGRALTEGDDMLGEEGRVVESVYHVGDELWEFEP